MAGLFRHPARPLLSRAALGRLAAGLTALALLLPLPAPAQDDSDLHDRPVLVVDPGMHTAGFWRASADATGRFAATGSDDKTVRIWSLEDGTLERTIRVPAGPGNVGKIFAVAISPDGALVAAGGFTAGRGGQIQIYLFDRASGALIQRVSGLPAVVEHLVFSPDGRHLAATLGGAEGLRVYGRAARWAEAARDSDYGGESYGAAFAHDGRIATTGFDGLIRLYDSNFVRQGVRKVARGQRPYGIAFSPDGGRLAVGFDDSQAVEILDGRTLVPQPGPDQGGIDNGDLSKVVWSSDGRTLFAGGRYVHDGNSQLVAWAGAGRGGRRLLGANQNTIMSLASLADGGLLVAAGDPYLARLDSGGTPRWVQGPPMADFRAQHRTLAVSTDGAVVDFGYEMWGRAPARFDLRTLRLMQVPAADGKAAAPLQGGLPIEDWVNATVPTFAGAPLPLQRFETSRSMAVQPGAERFVLGTEWNLHAFHAGGKPLWTRPAPSAAWAVNVSGDGRLVVAAYGDGTIRWHRMDDGRELLAFMPLIDRVNWVAWTPEGFYAATPGARGVLKWHVNRGWDQPADAIPVADIPNLYRPDALPLVLREMETARALGLADMDAARRAVQRRTGSAPGARLHVLTVGIDEYGAQAKHLRLNYAAADARDVASALAGEQGSLYAKVNPQFLHDKEADKPGILRALESMRGGMEKGSNQDLAVLLFSGHAAMVDGQYYLLPYGVDARDSVGIKSSALSLPDLRQELRKLATAGRVLVLLDTCHSGAVGNAAAPDARALSTALADSNITVLTSSGADQRSRENEQWRHGAFTFALLGAFGKEADTDHNGMISVSELFAYVTNRVSTLTGGLQATGMEVRFEGDLFAAGL